MAASSQPQARVRIVEVLQDRAMQDRAGPIRPSPDGAAAPSASAEGDSQPQVNPEVTNFFCLALTY